MKKSIFILALIAICSCDEKSTTTSAIPKQTIYYKGFSDQNELTLIYDTLSSDSLVPRNTWVQVDVKTIGEMSEVLENSDLILSSNDTNFRIEKLSENRFSFFANQDYSSIMTYHSWGDHFIENEYLDIDVYVKPHKNFQIIREVKVDSSVIKPGFTFLYRFHEPLITKKAFKDITDD